MPLSSVKRITVLANRDLASCIALNRLLPRIHERASISVFLSSAVGKKQIPDVPPPQELQQFAPRVPQVFASEAIAAPAALKEDADAFRGRNITKYVDA